MRHAFQLVALLALAACQVVGQQTGGGVKVEVAMQASRWIVGEAPQITEVWTNIGDKPVLIAYGAEPSSHFAHVRILGAIRKDCQGDRKMIEEGGLVSNPQKFEPGKVFRAVHSLRDYGVVDAGHYEAWIEYDTVAAPAYLRQAGLAPLHLESNHVEFDILQPQGIDAEVLLKYGNKCHQIALSPQDLLAKFPASTYAGYALAEKVPDYSNPLFKPVPPAEQVRMSREEGKTVVVFPDKTFEQYFQQLDAHVKGGNVPESLRAELYGFYGDLLIQRGRFAEAEAAFCQAVKEKPGDAKGEAYFTRAQQFLDALNKHGA
jgi:hypothetical protein